MSIEDNSHAGQGPVLLDIGGDIGAIILAMPARLNGQEVEARPIAGPALASARPHTHDGHEHHHQLTHVGVVTRPTPDGPSATAVFGELVEGTYELYLRPAGPVALTVTVTGGEVSSTDWPL
jgi:hypothetical protein